MSDSCDPADCSLPASSVHGILQYWSGLPFPSPGDLPNPGVKPGFPALQVGSLQTELQGKPSHGSRGATQMQRVDLPVPGQRLCRCDVATKKLEKEEQGGGMTLRA